MNKFDFVINQKITKINTNIVINEQSFSKDFGEQICFKLKKYEISP